MSTELYKEVNYSAQINYYSGYIVEYDLRKANISALLDRGIIDQNKYQFLHDVDKGYREFYVGNMIKFDENIYKEIQAGIIDAKRMFVELNNIQDEEILEIRNDAIFILTDRPMIEQVNSHYYFAKKNSYTFFIKFFNGNEFFYRYDTMSNSDTIEVKGISDENVALHQNYIIKFIADTIFGIQQNNIENVISDCNIFYQKYINRMLPIEYYREFNSTSCYRLFFSCAIPNASQDNIDAVDIRYNLGIIRNVISVVDNIYFQKLR